METSSGPESANVRRRAGHAERRARERGVYVARRLGASLREARLASGLRQADVARRAGLSQPEISELERGHGAGSSLMTWAMAAEGIGEQLVGFLEGVPGAERPRDYQHLKGQQLVIEAAGGGRWVARPELLLDTDAERGRSIDVALLRAERREAAVVEIWNFFNDVGAAQRSLDGKIATLERQLTTVRDIRDAGPFRVAGLWVVRGTKRNRKLVREFSAFFSAAFTGGSRDWLGAITDSTVPMPIGNGMVWTDVAGTVLRVARLPRRSAP